MPPGIFSKIFKRSTDRDNYERRRAKVYEALEKLRNDAQKGPMLRRLEEIEAIAAGGDYQRAYNMLDTQKTAARGAVKDAKAGGAVSGTITLGLSNLKRAYNGEALDHVRQYIADVRRMLQPYRAIMQSRVPYSDDVIGMITRFEVTAKSPMDHELAERKRSMANLEKCIEVRNGLRGEIDRLRTTRNRADADAFSDDLAAIGIPEQDAADRVKTELDAAVQSVEEIATWAAATSAEIGKFNKETPEINTKVEHIRRNVDVSLVSDCGRDARDVGAKIGKLSESAAKHWRSLLMDYDVKLRKLKLFLEKKNELLAQIDGYSNAVAGVRAETWKRVLGEIEIPTSGQIDELLTVIDACVKSLDQAHGEGVSEKAKEAYLGAKASDADTLGKGDVAPLNRYQLKQVSMGALLGDGTGGTLQRLRQRDEKARTEVAAKKKKSAGRQADVALDAVDREYDKLADRLAEKVLTPAKIKEFFEEPDSDEAFDLLTATQKELETRIAEAFEIDAKTLTPKERALIQKVADKVRRTAAKVSPNKLNGALDPANPPATMRLNEATYVIDTDTGKNGVLGRGGFGVAVCYINRETQERVVVKIALKKDRDAAFAETAQEAKAHRKVMGGKDASDARNKNLMGLKGVVTTEDGGIAMVSEYCEAGGLDKLSQNVQAASDAGLISAAARNAMSRRMMKQTIMGVKQMREAGLVHGDLKEENVFVSEDGTIKVADFGSTRTVDDEGRAEMVGTTREYESRGDIRDDSLSRQYDTYSLGVMLEKIAGGSLGAKSRAETGVHAPKKQAPTAFDRLRNAMLSTDASKRPTLDAVLESTYMQDADASYSEADVEELNRASMAYSRAVQKCSFDVELWGIVQDANHQEWQSRACLRDMRGNAKTEKAVAKLKISTATDFYHEAKHEVAALKKKKSDELTIRRCTEDMESLEKAIKALQKNNAEIAEAAEALKRANKPFVGRG